MLSLGQGFWSKVSWRYVSPGNQAWCNRHLYFDLIWQFFIFQRLLILILYLFSLSFSFALFSLLGVVAIENYHHATAFVFFPQPPHRCDKRLEVNCWGRVARLFLFWIVFIFLSSLFKMAIMYIYFSLNRILKFSEDFLFYLFHLPTSWIFPMGFISMSSLLIFDCNRPVYYHSCPVLLAFNSPEQISCENCFTYSLPSWSQKSM